MRRLVCLYGAWGISLVALLGSFYVSEVLHVIPCSLCWYQRIALFPLALLLAIAIYRADFSIWIYALPLALVAFGLAIWQLLLLHLPELSLGHVCGSGASCSESGWVIWKFIDLPFLSAVGSFFLSVLLVFSRKKNTVE